MRFGGQIGEFAGHLLGLDFMWEPGTEILSAKTLGSTGLGGTLVGSSSRMRVGRCSNWIGSGTSPDFG